MFTNCHVILTDDDADDRMFLAEALKKNNFSGYLCEAENGNLLLEMLETKKERLEIGLPILIVLDLNMPLLSGFEVLKVLKNDSYFNEIPIAVLTSSSRFEDETFCKNAGCSKYFKKPHLLSGYDEIARELLAIINSNFVHDNSKS